MGWENGFEPSTAGATIRCSSNCATPNIVRFMGYLTILWTAGYSHGAHVHRAGLEGPGS